MNRLLHRSSLLIAALLLPLCGLSTAMAQENQAETEQQSRSNTGPLKVYILAGQSNMQGKAKSFTLEQMARDPKTVPMLEKIQTEDGEHRVYEDVWISAVGCSRDEMNGNLTVGYGGGDKIGPELTFGIYLYEHVQEPVLLIKTAWGGKSLAIDFRPPSAGPLELLPEEKRGKCGHYYRLMMQHVHKVLGDIKRVYPAYDEDKGYNVEGFVWFQGCNDFGGLPYPDCDKPGGFDEYSRLLACLIRDIRKEVKSPDMRAVIGVLGINGELDTNRFRQIDKPEYIPRLREFRRAQAVPASMPEFKNSVAAVYTQKYWDPRLEELQSRWSKIKKKSNELERQDLTGGERKKAMDAFIKTVFTDKEWELYGISISNAAYHYMGAAKIYGQIGKAFAEAMTAPDRAKTVNASIEALKKHITGVTKLDAATIETHTQTINDNADVIRYQESTIQSCFDLVNTYDKEKGPLWVEYNKLHHKKDVPGDEIHWAVFWVMQNLMDQIYNSEGMRKHGELLDGFAFGCADYFPGKVEPPEDPDNTYTVKINGSYPKTWGGPVMHMDHPARKPTGAYLVPGTIVKVRVPDSMVNQGYKIRVGAHSWDLSEKPRVARLHRCTALYDVDRNEVPIANPLGGGIYIEVPYKADAGIVDITIVGAARCPYFSSKPFHKTTNKQWREVERNRKAPWADFQSEKFMMQVPTSWIYKLDDPETLIADWDKAVDAVNDLMGRPHKFGRETLYPQVDLQLRGRALFPGYPSVNCWYNPNKDYGGYHTHHLVRGPQHAIGYEFHELGHQMLFCKYKGDREAAVNLLQVAVLNRAFDVDLIEAFGGAPGEDGKIVKTLENTALAWMMSDHFIDDGFMRGYERQYQPKGHAKFVDIVRLFGWKVLDNFWHSINQDYMDGNPWPRDVVDTDRYTQRLSEVSGSDLRPLIHFWGIPTQNDEESDAAIKEKNIKPSAKVYNLLLKYKSLVPKDNEAFREYALTWWGKEPSPDGYTTERNHARRWKNYDKNMAEKTRQTVQAIIDRYFPDGRPEE